MSLHVQSRPAIHCLSILPLALIKRVCLKRTSSFYLSLSILVSLSLVPRLQLLIAAGLHKTILKALLMSVRGVFAQDPARGVRLLCQCFE